VPRTSDKDWVCFEQRAEGNEHAPGNVALVDKVGFRAAVDKARERAKELKESGKETKVLKELQAAGHGFGYRVTEPPLADGQPGAQWNLLVLKRTIDPVKEAMAQMVGSQPTATTGAPAAPAQASAPPQQVPAAA
jgi:hypothetical protein